MSLLSLSSCSWFLATALDSSCCSCSFVLNDCLSCSCTESAVATLVPSFWRTSEISCCCGQAGAPSIDGGELEHFGGLVGAGVAAGGFGAAVGFGAGAGVGVGGLEAIGEGVGDGGGAGGAVGSAWTG